MITLLDLGRDRFVGTRDIRAVLDRDVDRDGTRRVTVRVVAGADDTNPGIKDSDATRVARAQTLHSELVRNDVPSEFVQVHLAVASCFRRALR